VPQVSVFLRWRASFTVAPIGLAVLLATGFARADVTKAQCIDANAKGQDLRRSAKLSAAREQFHACADPGCPALVRDDCAKRLDEADRAQPTVVFDAKDGSGHDLSAVKVTVDGRPLVDKLDGTAVQVDPGEHEFTFTTAGEAPVTEKLVINESAKERHESLTIGAAQPAPPSPAATAAPANAEGMGTQKMVAVGVGAVGIVGVALGSVFGVLTASAISSQKSDCASATNCPRYAQAASDHSTWSTDGTVSTVAFAAGAALLAGGVVLWLTAPHPAGGPSPAALVVAPSVGSSGGVMLVRGEF
jgi:hypothetical protein